MIASARSSTAARRSSISVRDALPATSTIRRRTRGAAVACWSVHSCSASRCGAPLGQREPERSSSAVTFSGPGTWVGMGVGEVTGLAGAVHAPSAATIARRSARMRALRARAVGKRGVLGVHVLCGIFRLWIRLALGLRDGAFDLVGKRCAERIEVCLGHARREQVRVRALHRVLRAPLLDLLLGPIPAVVIVGGVGLIAITLELDEAWPAAGAGAVARELRLLVAVEHIHPVGAVSRHAVGGGLLGDVLYRGLLLEARRDRQQVVLDNKHHRKRVNR